jgi:polysaccharide export outer membrane protein
MSKRYIRLGALLGILSLGAMGCGSPRPVTIANEVQTEASPYRIGASDVLAIDVWENAAISRTVVVRPDGMISLPLLNDVHAAGLTPEQLRAELTKRLHEYIPNVEVSVVVSAVNSMKVSVLGEVGSPGRYAFESRMTVLDALALAGGLKDFAARKRIVIMRQEGQERQYLYFDYDKVVAGDGTVGNFALRPGDIILVPLAGF